MNQNILRAIVAAFAILIPCAKVSSWLGDAQKRYTENRAALAAKPSDVPVAAMAEDNYCTPQLKAIVRRVAGACGLVAAGGGEGGRGCQPQTAQSVASLSGEDFNSLFLPLQKRAHIIQFDPENTELDDTAKAEVEKAWADQRGASFFFVVSRASPDGDPKLNEEYSAKRAQAVLAHLENKFHDPDLKKEVGLLWLGAGFAQLSADFCTWQRSRAGTTTPCTEKEINRSAFIAWIDCAI